MGWQLSLHEEAGKNKPKRRQKKRRLKRELQHSTAQQLTRSHNPVNSALFLLTQIDLETGPGLEGIYFLLLLGQTLPYIH